MFSFGKMKEIAEKAKQKVKHSAEHMKKAVAEAVKKRHAEESDEERFQRVEGEQGRAELSKIEIRYREARGKRAEMNQKQDEEETALKEKIKEQKGSTKILEADEEAKIQRKVYQENAGKILCCAEGNSVVKFNLESFDPKDPRTGRMEGQYAGNHFTLGITLFGFIQLLSITLWNDGKGNVLYKRDEKKFWDEKKNACWNNGELNGYDVCQHVKEYLQKIGKLHQSLLEVIMEGKVGALKCLQEHVGLADAFFSHMQALPIATMLETLEDAGTRFSKELLHDPVATVALRKKALEEFLQAESDKNPGSCDRGMADPIVRTFTVKQIDEFCQNKFGSAPALATITAQKNTGAPKFFIDYCGIRQCLKSDFTIERVLGAIETTGTTVVELDADVLGPDALLRRIFCVLESFATIKAKGVLLVCGPGLNDPAQMLKLAELAADSTECKAVMDSLTAKCRWEEEAIKIKTYIQRTVGFARTDKVVLGAIIRCIVASAESVFAARADGGSGVLGAIGWMIFETGDYAAALGLLEAALAKGEAAYGAEAAEIADTVYRIGRCLSKLGETTGSRDPRMFFERDLRIQAKAHGSEEHASTARSLVGMGVAHFTAGVHGKDALEKERAIQHGNECFERAIRRIQAAGCPEDYADDHADALVGISGVHSQKQEWRVCLQWSRRSVEVRAAKHGPDHALAVSALGTMADAHGNLGDPDQAMALQLRILGILERAQGPLSRDAGVTCGIIGTDYCNRQHDYPAAATWFTRSVEASEYNSGPAGTKAYRDVLKQAIDRIDPADPMVQEHREFLAAAEERARGVERTGEAAKEEAEQIHLANKADEFYSNANKIAQAAGLTKEALDLKQQLIKFNRTHNPSMMEEFVAGQHDNLCAHFSDEMTNEGVMGQLDDKLMGTIVQLAKKKLLVDGQIYCLDSNLIKQILNPSGKQLNAYQF
jgi:tetratricopeptide (TPR) repeat protein